MVAKHCWWCVVAILVISSCGGSSSPEEKCQDLVDTVCDRLSTCLGEPSQKDDCVHASAQTLSCSAAKSVADSYDGCMDDLEGASCNELLHADSDGNPVVSLPDRCHAVIFTGTLGPPSASYVGVGDAAHVVGL